jgi:endo-1,4-beta-D-glucanase Y
MVIVVLMGGSDSEAKKIFDGLYKFVIAHPACADNIKANLHQNLMQWRVPAGEDDMDSAFDGDADIAYALLMADRQWGSNGEINYLQAAKNTIAQIKKFEIGPKSYLPMLGDNTGADDTYKPTAKKPDSNQYTPRSSDFMLDNFRAFAYATGDTDWNLKVIKNVQNLINIAQSTLSQNTGLLPDFMYLDTKTNTVAPICAKFISGETNCDKYYFNACRDPWRIGLDVLMSNNSVSREEVNKITKWFMSDKNRVETPSNINAGYNLDGTPVGKDLGNAAFIAPLGVAAMAYGNNGDAQAFLDNIYNFTITTNTQKKCDYFESTISMICLIIMSGNYWSPSIVK